MIPNQKWYIEFILIQSGIQHYFIGRPSDSTVSEDAGIEPRTVATTALAVKRSNHLAISNSRKVISVKVKEFSTALKPFFQVT